MSQQQGKTVLLKVIQHVSLWSVLTFSPRSPRSPLSPIKPGKPCTQRHEKPREQVYYRK